MNEPDSAPEGSRIFVKEEASTVICAVALSQFTPLARMKKRVASLGIAMRETSVVPASTGMYWSAIRRTAPPSTGAFTNRVVMVRMPTDSDGIADV